MKIIAIRYRRLRSHDQGYGHDAIEAEAQIGADETASHALQELKHWVLERLEEGARVERLARTEEAAERRLARLKSEENELAARVQAGRKIIDTFEDLGPLVKEKGLIEAYAALERAGLTDEIPF